MIACCGALGLTKTLASVVASLVKNASPDVPAASSERPRTLLVVDDDPANRRALRRAFDQEYTVYEAPNGPDALALARRIRPDVLISDQRMPTMSGVELLTTLKQELPHSVRVLVTGYHDYACMVDAVNAARIHHYVEKPFHTTDLRAIVGTLVRAEALQAEKERLMSELRGLNRELEERSLELERLVAERTRNLEEANAKLTEANQRLREKSVRDELTGAFNRRALLEQLELEVQRSNRYGREFSVLFFDVDDFKQVNDTYGHAAGDAVLRHLSDRLRSADHGARRSDFVARYGGEEFCVLLPETTTGGARIKAERVRRGVEEMHIEHAGCVLRVTVSVGVAGFPQHGNTGERLLCAADQALYAAKRAGKNRVCQPAEG